MGRHTDDFAAYSVIWRPAPEELDAPENSIHGCTGGDVDRRNRLRSEEGRQIWQGHGVRARECCFDAAVENARACDQALRQEGFLLGVDRAQEGPRWRER